MRLLPRYVLIELIKVFAVTVTSLTTLMVLAGVAKEAIEQGLGLIHVVQMLPYILPNALLLSVPGSMLFATSIVYGRMSGANEIVAIKSLGINPMTVLWPALVLSFLLSLVCVWLNDIAVSWGFNNVQRVAIEALDDIAYGMLQTQKSFSANRFTINVKRVDGRRLIKPVVTFAAAGASPPTTITARKGSCAAIRSGMCWSSRSGRERSRSPDKRPITLTPRSGKSRSKMPAARRTPTTIRRTSREGCAGRGSPPARSHRSAAHGYVGAGRLCAGDGGFRGTFAAALDRRAAEPRVPGRPGVSLQYRAAASLGQRVQLPVLRSDRRADGDSSAELGRVHQLFRLLSADPGRLLSIVDLRSGPGQGRGIAPLQRMVGKRHPGAVGDVADAAGYQILTGAASEV